MRSPIVWFNQTFHKELIESKVKQAMKIHPVCDHYLDGDGEDKSKWHYVVTLYVYFMERVYGTGPTLKEAYDKANQNRYKFYYKLFSKKPNLNMKNLKHYDKRNYCESDD